MSDYITSDARLERISELESALRPINMNLENLQENIKRALEISNETLAKCVSRGCLNTIESDTEITFNLQENYSRLIVSNESRGRWYHGFELTIESSGFNRFNLIGDDKESFDVSKIDFSISGASSSAYLTTLQALDTEIVKSFLCVELKKFGKDKEAVTFFSILVSALDGYYKMLGKKMEIQQETYPIKQDITDNKNAIADWEKDVQDALILTEIENSVGKDFEFDTLLERDINGTDEKLWRVIDGRRMRYDSLRILFNLNWNPSTITVLKVNPKTVNIQLGTSIHETKRVKKDILIEIFEMLREVETKSENV